MKPLTKKKKDEIEEFLTKGYRAKKGGYIILELYNKKKKKMMKRSRAYWQYFNRIEITPYEIVHHRDENRENDDITNLEVIDTKNFNHHTSLHSAGKRRKKNLN